MPLCQKTKIPMHDWKVYREPKFQGAAIELPADCLSDDEKTSGGLLHYVDFLRKP